jgi:hypothetical protein
MNSNQPSDLGLVQLAGVTKEFQLPRLGLFQKAIWAALFGLLVRPWIKTKPLYI